MQEPMTEQWQDFPVGLGISCLTLCMEPIWSYTQEDHQLHAPITPSFPSSIDHLLPRGPTPDDHMLRWT